VRGDQFKSGSCSKFNSQAVKLLKKKVAEKQSELPTGELNPLLNAGTLIKLFESTVGQGKWSAAAAFDAKGSHDATLAYADLLGVSQTGNRGDSARAQTVAGVAVSKIESTVPGQKAILADGAKHVKEIVVMTYDLNGDKTHVTMVKKGTVPHRDVQICYQMWLGMSWLSRHCLMGSNGLWGKMDLTDLENENLWKEQRLHPLANGDPKSRQQHNGQYQSMFEKGGCKGELGVAVNHIGRKHAVTKSAGSNTGNSSLHQQETNIGTGEQPCALLFAHRSTVQFIHCTSTLHVTHPPCVPPSRALVIYSILSFPG
jgi:hypothetical protein